MCFENISYSNKTTNKIMRTFATLAVLAAAVSAECFDIDKYNNYCDGEWV